MAERRFNPRAMMQRAIEEMNQSVAEPRTDGKASPKVGAVLIPPEGPLVTAHRGELRYGDHAEFTLLERKCRDRKLDGSILFVTLEPCAPGARNHPKLPCADRIILARIKQVYVGIEDPDPTVDRKGIKYLQDQGVTVHMFERDLQEQIRAANKDFIAQAMERAAAAEEQQKPQTVTLSRFEDPVLAVISDLSRDALEQFRAAAKIVAPIDSVDFHRRLRQQGLLKESGGGLAPSGFGLLLFGKQPRTVLRQAGLLATIRYPGGKEEPRDFDGPMVLIPGEVEQWLSDKLPNTINRSHMKHESVPELPFELIREAVVNALVHRDYEIAGGKCQLIVTSDTVIVKSPGGPLPPITLDQLQSFSAPMLSRNPELHYVFSQMALAEERGLGMQTLRSLAEELRLPLPKYAMDDPYLVLTLYRSAAGAALSLTPNVLESLSKAERAGWLWLATKESTTSAEYAQAMGVPNRTALNHLKRFTALSLLQKTGSGPKTKYRVRR
jgi:ATP-dependent DNA helicase RecG